MIVQNQGALDWLQDQLKDKENELATLKVQVVNRSNKINDINESIELIKSCGNNIKKINNIKNKI